MKRAWFLMRLREMDVQLPKDTVNRLFDLARNYDDIVSIEIDPNKGQISIAFKRIIASMDNIVVRQKVERYTVRLLEDRRC